MLEIIITFIYSLCGLLSMAYFLEYILYRIRKRSFDCD